MKIPLTHLRFLDRAEIQFGRKTGVIDGESTWTYAEYASRCRQLANLLEKMNLSPGARVACLAYNTHERDTGRLKFGGCIKFLVPRS